MPREAKPPYTNGKGETIPLHYFASLMESYSTRCTNKDNREENQKSSNHTTSWRKLEGQIRQSIIQCDVKEENVHKI